MISSGIEVAELKEPKGYSVKFPFELKDAFRVAFPSAKWDPEQRHWTVGPRSKNRLDTWVEEARAAADAVIAHKKAQSEADFVKEELARVRGLLAAEEQRNREIESVIATIKRSRELLEMDMSALEIARSKRLAGERALSQEKAEIDDLLKKIINIEEVRAAAKVMAFNMIPASRSKKALFEDAREKIKHARNQLREAGYSLVAISELAQANVNRPDRDHPKFLTERDWYSLYTETPSEDKE